jgi:hypothetical protein
MFLSPLTPLVRGTDQDHPARGDTQRVYEDDEDETSAVEGQETVEGVEVPDGGEPISERVGQFEEVRLLPLSLSPCKRSNSKVLALVWPHFYKDTGIDS